MASRNDIWENSGASVTGETWQTACENSPLNWQVDKLPVTNAITGENTGWAGIYRDDTNECLAIHKASYNPVQNHQLFSFLDEAIGGDIRYNRAGFFGNGEKVFVQATLGEFDILGSGDKHQTYFTALNSHDGSIAETYKTTETRIVCRNTFDFVVRDKHGKEIKIRHSINSAERRAEAVILIQTARQTANNAKEIFEELAQRRVNTDIVAKTIAGLFKLDLTQDLSTERQNQVLTINDLFESNDNNAFPEFRGTAYNLINSISEYTDHFRKSQNSRQRAYGSIFGEGAKLKQRGIELVAELTRDAERVNQMKSYSFAQESTELVSELLGM